MVYQCSGCGRTHLLKIERLKEPESFNNRTYGWSGECTNSGERVFIGFNHRKEAVHAKK